MNESPRGLSRKEIDFFSKNGYLIVKGVLSDDDFLEFETDYAKLIDKKATELFEQNKISDLKEGLSFKYRFAAIAEQCDDQVFREEIVPFCRTLDCMIARTEGFFNFLFNPKLLAVVESIVGPEITINPIQHVRAYLPCRNGQHNRNVVSDDGTKSTAVAHPALAPWHVSEVYVSELIYIFFCEFDKLTL